MVVRLTKQPNPLTKNGIVKSQSTVRCAEMMSRAGTAKRRQKHRFICNGFDFDDGRVDEG
jgi:hypothetical protein